MKRSWPVLLTAAVALLFVGMRLLGAGWDPMALAEIGTRFSEGDPGGTEGYDGQFTYYMARELAPKRVASYLDVPAYRYQRILLPVLARVLSLGQDRLIGWSVLVINLVAHLVGTWGVTEMVHLSTGKRRYGLVYGLWVGLVVGIGTFLHEPLAFGMTVLGLWARSRGHWVRGAVLLGLGLFAKETTLVFYVGLILIDVLRGRRASLLSLGLVGLVYAAFQVYLLAAFGAFGLGSGGAMATAFEIIPLYGLIRVAFVDLAVFAAYVVVFGPGVLLPTLWGLWQAARDVLHRSWSLEVILLALHAALVLFLPFSTFREPMGLVRIASGLVLAFLLYAARNRRFRPLNYAMFLPSYLVLLVPAVLRAVR